MLFPTALVLAAAAPAAGPGGADGPICRTRLLFIGVMVVLMYFLMLRPQQQRQQASTSDMIGAVKRGDTVVLSSGVIGKVVRVEDTELGVEIAQNVTIKVIKSMISEVRARGEPAAGQRLQEVLRPAARTAMLELSRWKIILVVGVADLRPPLHPAERAAGQRAGALAGLPAAPAAEPRPRPAGRLLRCSMRSTPTR